jgi:hypothetical protein
MADTRVGWGKPPLRCGAEYWGRDVGPLAAVVLVGAAYAAGG